MRTRIGQRHTGGLVAGNHVDRIIGRRAGAAQVAAFAQGAFVQIREKLIEPGTVRWVFHDYPLDQLALTASMVARYLPVDRYEPFINALFATQNRWAFSRSGNPTDELWKTAALAGMSRATFDQAISDDGLRKWILEQ